MNPPERSSVSNSNHQRRRGAKPVGHKAETEQEAAAGFVDTLNNPREVGDRSLVYRRGEGGPKTGEKTKKALHASVSVTGHALPRGSLPLGSSR